jgi:hypothetical protein
MRRRPRSASRCSGRWRGFSGSNARTSGPRRRFLATTTYMSSTAKTLLWGGAEGSQRLVTRGNGTEAAGFRSQTRVPLRFWLSASRSIRCETSPSCLRATRTSPRSKRGNGTATGGHRWRTRGHKPPMAPLQWCMTAPAKSRFWRAARSGAACLSSGRHLGVGWAHLDTGCRRGAIAAFSLRPRL